MNQRRHHQTDPKPVQDPSKPCQSCIHHIEVGSLVKTHHCLLAPVQPQLITFQRSHRGICGPLGLFHELPWRSRVWVKVKTFFGIKR